MVIFCC